MLGREETLTSPVPVRSAHASPGEGGRAFLLSQWILGASCRKKSPASLTESSI